MLDDIAGGRRDRNTELAEFYFGSGEVEGLKKLVSELGDIDARKLSTFPLGDLESDAEGSGIAVRVGRYGTYVEDAENRRANVADDLPPDELTVDLSGAGGNVLVIGGTQSGKSTALPLALLSEPWLEGGGAKGGASFRSSSSTARWTRMVSAMAVARRAG